MRAVAARGGLAGYLHVLDSAYTYLSLEVIVLGILESGDMADVMAALAPRPVAVAELVDGRNLLAPAAGLEQTLAPARRAYEEARAADRFRTAAEFRDPAAWLVANLK